MTDFIWQNFGLIELLLCTELVILLTAAFFYQVARYIAKTDHRDPLVRFYRVFWQAFKMPVTSIKELDLRQAEYAARSAGLAAIGEVSGEQMSNLDAPDMVDLDAIAAPAASASTTLPDAPGTSDAPASRVQAIGRTGAESDPRLRTEPGGPSRELQFAQRDKPMPIDDDAPLPVMREREAPPARGRGAPSTQTAVSSTFDASITAFQPQGRIAGVRNGEVLIDVTCSPEDGQANGTIIALMAKHFGVRPYQIVLLRGHYKVRKTLQVTGVDQYTLDQRIARI